MRVLFATKHIHFPQGGGGGERNTHELCLRLKRHGVTPAVMCSLRSDRRMLTYRNRILRKLSHNRFPEDSGCGYAVYRGWEQDDGVAEVLSRFRPDIVVIQSGEPLLILRAFAAAGVPRIVYFHEVIDLGTAPEICRSEGVSVITNSAFAADRIRREIGFAPAVVRPLIDPAFYITPVTPGRVLFVNTVPRKGVEIAFALAEARRDIGFDFVLSWILTPDQKAAMSARAQRLGNVVLHAPTNDMRALYARARIVLVPSQCDEAWGRVATEAQINGIPVLASERGGLPEAVGPGGILVPSDAPMTDWVRALSLLWDDDAAYQRFAQAATAHAKRDEIQPDSVAAAFIAQLRAAMHASPGEPARNRA